MTEISKDVMTAQDVADHFGVHLNTVYAWVKTGAIPFERVGKLLRFRKGEVVAWAKQAA